VSPAVCARYLDELGRFPKVFDLSSAERHLEEVCQLGTD